MAVFNNALAGAAGSGGAAGYEIERSLRFNSADSAYLSRTPGSAGNRKTWTWSGWVKKAVTGSVVSLIGVGTDSVNLDAIDFQDECLRYTRSTGGSFLTLKTTSVYRDPSAWYHVVVAVDTTQATAADRVKFYINGTEQTAFSSSSYPSQNEDTFFNSTNTHTIGRRNNSQGDYFDGYLADVHFIDGKALDPTDFGEFDDNGVWQPIEYTSTFAAPVTQTPALDGAMIIKADGAQITGSVAGSGLKCLYTSSNGINWTFQNRESVGPFQTFAKYLAIGAAGTNDITFIPGNGESFTYAMYSATTDFTTQSDITVDTTSLSYSAGGTTSYGTNGFHLDFADNSSAAALGYDAAGSNDWTVNNIVASATDYASTGTITGTAGVATLSLDGIFDGNLTGTYWQISSSGTHNATVTFSPKLPSGTTIEIHCWSDGSTVTSGVIEVNGTDISSSMTMNYPGAWVDVSGAAAGGIQTIKIYRQDGIKNAAVSGIRVDGTVLISASPADIDSLRDSPTNGDTANDTGAGGEVPGNYCTFNPLDKGSTITLANGNLDVTVTGGYQNVRSTMFLSSGKWYWEITCPTIVSGSGAVELGVATSELGLAQAFNNTGGWSWWNGGAMRAESTALSNNSSYTGGDILGFALDQDANTLSLYKNGTLQSVSFSSLPDSVAPAVGFYGSEVSGTLSANFGQRAFAYSAPSGYKALCTANLDDPTIADGSTAMDVALYTGNGSTQTISGLGFSPDFVWTKRRSGAVDHFLFDAVRGSSNGNFYELRSNTTDAEGVPGTPSVGLTSLTSDGFTLGSDSSVNANTESFVAWTWDAGSSTVSNTAGSITSSVRANASAGFSIVSWTGNGSTSQTIGHGLGVSPSMVLIKNRDANEDWVMWFTGLSVNEYFYLDSAAKRTYSGSWGSLPTSSVFSNFVTHGNTNNYVAYCFAPVEGYSAFGSYTGSTDGPFVYTNFRPALVVCKCTTLAQPWQVYDSARGAYNVIDEGLQWNSSNAEYTGTDRIDFLSNGFKVKAPSNSEPNVSGQTYVYMALAENPFKYARAR